MDGPFVLVVYGGKDTKMIGNGRTLFRELDYHWLETRDSLRTVIYVSTLDSGKKTLLLDLFSLVIL